MIARRGIAWVALAAAFAQRTPDPDEPVIRVSVDLVQVDVVVTSRNGRPVKDLTKDDFVILQDGKRKEISSFYIVRTADPAAAAPRRRPPDAPGPPPVPSREQVKRTVALVVDDLGMSFQSSAYVRHSVRNFIDKDMQDGDLVAILRTGGGMGAFEEFTGNREMLRTVASRLGFNPMSRAGVSPFGAAAQNSAEEQSAIDTQTDQRDDYLALGSLAAVHGIITGLREMPGRKSIVLLSEGLRISNSDGTASQVTDALRQLTDYANRAAVTVYTIDPRGLQTMGPSARDSVIGARPSTLPSAVAEEPATLDPTNATQQGYLSSQVPLIALATDTGGLFYRENNDISAALRQALNDQNHYYLLGYAPGEDLFQRGYNRIDVKVTKPGLTVRSRRGFLPLQEQQAPGKEPATAQQMLSAISSPFRASAIRTRLTCLFGAEKSQALVQSALHIDTNELEFRKDEKGVHQGRVEILMAGFDQTGAISDRTTQAFSVALDDAGLKAARSNGLTFMVRYRVNKPGPYQVRTVVRDGRSGRMGSASHFLNVPDLGKGRLALSGILLREPAAQGVEPYPNATPAARMFQRGRQLSWLVQIYNPKPKLESSLRVFRDGQPVFQTPFAALDAKPAKDPKESIAGATMKLGSAMAPGDYVLQLLVREAGAKGVVSQWIDFQIVP